MRKLFPTYIFRCMDTATIYDVIEVKGPVPEEIRHISGQMQV